MLLAVGATLSDAGALGPAAPNAGAPGKPSFAPPPPAATLCFWSEQGPACVERALASPQAAEPADEAARGAALLRALLAGPTPQERARGLVSAFPPGTRLAGFRLEADRTAVVRLALPPEALSPLDPAAFEAMVWQLAGTLEPLDWRDLQIQARNPVDGAWVPMEAFLPEMPVPRKEASPLPLAPSPLLTSGQERGGGGGEAAGGGVRPNALKGKTVYLSAGHGWLWNGRAWRTQRPPYPTAPYVGPIIEDHNNAEAVNQYLIRYLQNAGATVIPVRERDMNPAAVVVDNDTPGGGYTEAGTWFTSTLYPGYLGTTYRYATTVTGTATATATWAFVVPADGEYAVYAWAPAGDQPRPGRPLHRPPRRGTTEVVATSALTATPGGIRAPSASAPGRPPPSPSATSPRAAGRAVIADAIRVGGGVFSSLREVYTTTLLYPPNKPWWEVAAYYHVQRMGLTLRLARLRLLQRRRRPADVRPLGARRDRRGRPLHLLALQRHQRLPDHRPGHRLLHLQRRMDHPLRHPCSCRTPGRRPHRNPPRPAGSSGTPPGPTWGSGPSTWANCGNSGTRTPPSRCPASS